MIVLGDEFRCLSGSQQTETGNKSWWRAAGTIDLQLYPIRVAPRSRTTSPPAVFQCGLGARDAIRTAGIRLDHTWTTRTEAVHQWLGFWMKLRGIAINLGRNSTNPLLHENDSFTCTTTVISTP
jgi:hypothetical protein